MDIEQLKMLPVSHLEDLIASAKIALKFKKDAEYKTYRRTRFADCDNIAANIDQLENEEIVAINSASYFLPLSHGSKNMNVAGQYLPALMKQNWAHLFSSRAYSPERKFYVYAHLNPEGPVMRLADAAGGVYGGRPFYVGKGCGDRAFDLKRNQGHGKMLEKLTKRWAKDDIVKIIFTDLTEAEAYEAESKLIFFFGTVYGYKKGFLYNLDVPPTPVFQGTMIKMNTKQGQT